MTKREKIGKLLEIGDFEAETEVVFYRTYTLLLEALYCARYPDSDDFNSMDLESVESILGLGLPSVEEIWGRVLPEIKEYAMGLYSEYFSDEEVDELFRIYSSPIIARLEEVEEEGTEKISKKLSEIVGRLKAQGMLAASRLVN